MKKEKIVIGMSGGVDSSAAAYLLKEEGYDVTGVTMITCDEVQCGQDPSKDAKKVADEIGIPHYTVDFRNQFKSNVMDYFCREYLEGRTPNPCVVCNRFVKWEALLGWAKEIGADLIATGHYANIVKLPNGRYAVANADVSRKDQTYALYNLTQEQLAHTRMPVGRYEKDTIREIAAKAGISVAQKADSQDICFIPDGDYASFIKSHTGQEPKEGNFVDVNGNILGKHKGIIHYTVGQRKGLGVALGYPVFVLAIRPETNEVVLGNDEESLKREVKARLLNPMGAADFKELEGKRIFAKIRYNHRGGWCTLQKTGDDEITCTFEEPQRAVTPGQALVLYSDGYILGGGRII